MENINISRKKYKKTLAIKQYLKELGNKKKISHSVST